MKSCPKCNRTFPDAGQKFCTFDGGLLIAPQTFDPNMTIRQTTGEIAPPASEKPTSRDLPDPNATIADSSFASTIALPRNTGPTGPQTTSDFGQVYNPSSALGQEQTVALGQVPQPHVTPQPPPPAPAPPPPQPSAPVVTTAPTPLAPTPAKKKSKLPLIIVGILVFLFLGGGALAAIFFVVVKPRLGELK